MSAAGRLRSCAVAVSAVALAAVVSAGCGSDSPGGGDGGSGTFDVIGLVTLRTSAGDISHLESSGMCSGSGPYSDILGGAAVSIGDAGGAQVAVGSLFDGAYSAVDGSTAQCQFKLGVLS